MDLAVRASLELYVIPYMSSKAGRDVYVKQCFGSLLVY